MNDTSSDDVVERLRSAAAVVFADRPVTFAYVFGSRVAGRPRPDSDLDVAVAFDPEVPADRRAELCLVLARELQEEAAIARIDALVDLAEASIQVAGRALRDGVVIHSADDVARVRHFSRTMRVFGDHELHAARHLPTRLAALAGD